MVANVFSTSLVGLDAVSIHVETQVIGQLRRFTVVGLPDGVLREAKDRVRCAIENSGFAFPHGEVVVSLAPASLPKRGAGFDLPIAISILAADGQIAPDALRRRLFLAELALDGTLKPVAGEFAAACFVRDRGFGELILARTNARRACTVAGVRVIGARNLLELVSHLNSTAAIEPETPDEINRCMRPASGLSFGDVVGQHAAKRAFEIAAAGGHNLLMIGPPGSGKSMLARRLPSILPPLSLSEGIEVAKVYNAVQPTVAQTDVPGICSERPFRSPHHTTSAAGLIGGGSVPMPGEISLAHRGVLFLDEFPELRRDALESLREPLESRAVTISRAKERVRFPADFMLVAAMNPCPCGRYLQERANNSKPKAESNDICQCLPSERRRYLSRISGPILDRMDIHVWIPPVPIKDFAQTNSDDPTPRMAERVAAARQRQQERFQNAGRLNVQMTAVEAADHCKLGGKSLSLIEAAAKRSSLSARGYGRILRVARTIADLDEESQVDTRHVSEALQFRHQQASR